MSWRFPLSMLNGGVYTIEGCINMGHVYQTAMEPEEELERDDYGRIELPDSIGSHKDAADTALALVEYFNKDTGYEDHTLAQLSNSIQSVCRARWQNRGSKFSGRSRYGSRVTFVDGDGDAHTALVMEPEVSSMQSDEAWDPNKGEYVNPQEEYPLGTVQLIYTPDYNLSDGFNFDRLSDVEVATSVTPAKSPDGTYCYYPGWEYVLGE